MAVGPPPPDPLYDAQIGQIGRQRDDTLAELAGGRSRGLADYGYVEGPGGSLRFDVNNPFSKAALLKRLHDTQRRSVGQQMGSGGQLYSGAYQNAQDLSSRNQLQAQDSLQKSLQAFLAQNTAARTRARTGYETQAQIYGAERTSRIADNPLYDPTVGDPTAAAVQGGGPPAAAAAPVARPTGPAAAAAAQRQRQRQGAGAAVAAARARARAKKRRH